MANVMKRVRAVSMAAQTRRTIQALVRRGRWTFLVQAERGRQEAQVSLTELGTALSEGEIVEVYEKQQGMTAYLLLGFAGRQPLHALCALKERPGQVIVMMVM